MLAFVSFFAPHKPPVWQITVYNLTERESLLLVLHCFQRDASYVSSYLFIDSLLGIRLIDLRYEPLLSELMTRDFCLWLITAGNLCTASIQLLQISGIIFIVAFLVVFGKNSWLIDEGNVLEDFGSVRGIVGVWKDLLHKVTALMQKNANRVREVEACLT